MKHTKRIVVFAASLLAVVGESAGQSAYERASLEAYRWEVYAAAEMVAQARGEMDAARAHRTGVETGSHKKARNKVAQEKAKAERGNRDPDDLAKAEAKLFVVEKHFSVTEARMITAQSHLSAAEARIVSAEAVVVAAEAASEEAFVTALTAHAAVLEASVIALRALVDISTIDKQKPSEIGLLPFEHNDEPDAAAVTAAWERAALAARAAERAEAIVDALNDGGEVPQELLEPLPTEFGSVA